MSSSSRSARARSIGSRLGAVASAAGLVLSLGVTATLAAGDGSVRPGGVVPEGAFWVSASGSDHGDGSSASPWRTLERALSGRVPGDTIVVRAGTYGARGGRLVVGVSGTASEPITVMGEPDGPLPTVLGSVRVDGDRLRLRGLLFDGPTGQLLTPSTSNPLGEEVQIAIYGDGVEIADSEIRYNLWHAGIYVDGGRVRIVGNYIHHNGNFIRSAQANLDHGIYVGRGSGLIANNLIEHNLAHGVQLYPYASNVVVTHNTIVDNGKAGVMVAKEALDNTIVNNVVAFNRDNGVRSHNLTGAGNVVTRNVIWGNGSGNIGTSADGLTFRDNIVEDPVFVALDDYRITAASPATDAGDDNRTMPTDRTGARRPHGRAPDIGAHELE